MRTSERAVLVGAHHDHDMDIERGVEHEVEELAGELVAACASRDLLELVDDEQLRAGLVDAFDLQERADRVRPRHHDVRSPRRAAREATAADERIEAGAHERRLAAS